MRDYHRKVISKYKKNFRYFAHDCLKIKTKGATIEPFMINDAQAFLHKKIEDHRKRNNGRVRMAIIKGRQQGMSTYTEGRFFRAALLNCATNVFIVAHDGDATNNIFEMSKRFYDNLPPDLGKPLLKRSNRKELVFEDIDSSIRVGTAGSKEVGRSATVQYFHGSEVAFWDNAESLMAGLFQTIPEKSEVILESTANGVGGYFHDIVLQGLRDDSEWETIFIPWFWQKEYTKCPPEDFELTLEEREIMNTFELTEGQMYWRRMKISDDFMGREYLFNQEYPCTIEEAFISTQNGLLEGKYIAQARKSHYEDEVSPVVMGVDPARTSDKTVITIRKGRQVIAQYVFDKMTQTRLCGIIIRHMEKWNARMCFIDAAHGTGTYDRLCELGWTSKMRLVYFNETPIDRSYTNKRSEMYDLMRKWLHQEGEKSLPDNDDLGMELGLLPDMKQNSNNQLFMIPKEEIKKLMNGKSPDRSDSLVLTFAEPVNLKTGTGVKKAKKHKGYKSY